ncbi:MAG: deoxyribonuclease IV [Fibrobacterota bacterium]
MKYIGPHVSIAGGVNKAPERAAALGATGFALFTKNQRQWQAKPYTEEDIHTFRSAMRTAGYTPDMVLPHASYLINLCNPDARKRHRSRDALIDELRRCSQLGLKALNLHPGSHLNATDESTALNTVTTVINQSLAETESVRVIVENTAGQGTNLGYTLEHIARIIDGVHDTNRIGFCIDTCHAFSAGYDLSTPEAASRFFDQVHARIGREYLFGMHLNDSLNDFGSRKDRHASLGEGTLGMDIFEYIVSDSRFDGMPLILETPEKKRWKQEIALLTSLEQK